MWNRAWLRCGDTRRRASNSRWNADAHLRAHERTLLIEEEAIARIDTCQLAANSPIEDFYSSAKCLSSRAFLVGVFDGHGGPSCSRFVSSRLYPYLSASVLPKHERKKLPLRKRLEWLFSSSDSHLQSQYIEEENLGVQQYHDNFSQSKCGTVREALKSAFEACDDDLIKAALPDSKGIVDKHSAMIAASGSCATIAHIRSRHLHVANSGDGAAVLGVVSSSGTATARQLSRAHCVDNTDEVQRIRGAHPASETHVLRGGRLLGELFPLRAFGDVRYKWPLDLQKVVLEPLGAPPPPNLHTPPYLIASPEVYYHKLTSNDKFLVLATDGLWEWLDPDTVVRLVHDHTLGTMTLQPYQPKPGTPLKEVHAELLERRAGHKTRKKPIDDNCATHIIRHALGGVTGGAAKQYERLIDLLQIPPGRARSYRDDISVIVVHFNEKYLSQVNDDESIEDSVNYEAHK